MNAITQVMTLGAFFFLFLSGAEPLFQDNFAGRPGPGWSWLREHREAWRAGNNGLEVRIEPGNMWGPQNNAKNVLVRPAPDVTSGDVEISATVSNSPTHQYEQVDLVWYYDDSNMVKLGLELVDGDLSIVMGREQNDQTRTIGLIPVKATIFVCASSSPGMSFAASFSPPVLRDGATPANAACPPHQDSSRGSAFNSTRGLRARSIGHASAISGSSARSRESHNAVLKFWCGAPVWT